MQRARGVMRNLLMWNPSNIKQTFSLEIIVSKLFVSSKMKVFVVAQNHVAASSSSCIHLFLFCDSVPEMHFTIQQRNKPDLLALLKKDKQLFIYVASRAIV